MKGSWSKDHQETQAMLETSMTMKDRLVRSRNPVRQAKKEVLKASPLCKRGWVLQERLLSPRILYYSTDEFFWECLACTARESEMGLKAYRPATYVHQRYDCADVNNRLIQPPGPNPSLPLSPPLDWHIAVEYTRCQLTRQRTSFQRCLVWLLSLALIRDIHTLLVFGRKIFVTASYGTSNQPTALRAVHQILLTEDHLGPGYHWIVLFSMPQRKMVAAHERGNMTSNSLTGLSSS